MEKKSKEMERKKERGREFKRKEGKVQFMQS
jgi:hypothetical protein